MYYLNELAAINDYETWQRNDGKEFWASRAVTSQLSMAAKRTAVGIISKGEGIIETELGGSVTQTLPVDSKYENQTQAMTERYQG